MPFTNRGGRRDGARGRDSDNSSTLSSSSVSSSDHGHVTVATEHRQATPPLVDVASSAESLSKLTVTVDRAKPVSSRLAHARTAAIAAADAAADEKHETSVRRAYVTLGIKDVARNCHPTFSRLRKQRCRGTATDSIGKSNYDGSINAQR